jgi:hypothetical protein
MQNIPHAALDRVVEAIRKHSASETRVTQFDEPDA